MTLVKDNLHKLMVLKAQDGSSLVLAENPADSRQPFRLVFWHEDGAPEPVRGDCCALWVMVGGRQHVVFAGDVDEPDLDRVLLEFPHGSQTCRPRAFPHHPHAWMSFPEPLTPGMTVGVWWMATDHVIDSSPTDPLDWGTPWPPVLEPPPPPEPNADRSGWTTYAPQDD